MAALSSSTVFSSPNLAEQDHLSSEARQKSTTRQPTRPGQCRASIMQFFQNLVPQSVWRMTKKQSTGRDLVGVAFGFTVGTSIILAVLYGLVFISKPSSFRSNLPYDFITNKPPTAEGKSEDVLNRWLTEYSRFVKPKPCHSHNDYWRPYPLFSALVAGCTGVEADIWLSDDGTDLLVGHDRAALSSGNTLKSMYLDPLMKILNTENPDSSWANHTPYNQPNGVFKTNPNATLVLLIDVKSEPGETWPLLIRQLEPLRQKQFLTRYEHIQVSPGFETKQGRWPAAVTVVGTGNLDSVTFTRTGLETYPNFNAYHDTFMDAPLHVLPNENKFWRYEGNTSDPNYHGPSTGASIIWDVDQTYMTSTSLKQAIGSVRTGFSKGQLATLRNQIKIARKSGLRTRYWDIPDWPIGYRDYIWQVLTEEGVDLLNVDDLEGAVKHGWIEGYVKDVIWMAVVSAYIFSCGFAMLFMWRRHLRRQWMQRIADANSRGLNDGDVEL
ncbi:hypothetical protein LZ30DRAFT_653946 [Colletotrichum cereale]|nr:hypothetical protein LZ30DRAFT_653946 [Colletotrichum cereale]